MTNRRKILVGSRTSQLAIIQTEEVLQPLRERFPDLEFEIVPINPIGDRNKAAPLLSMERGMFVKEIEVALLNEELDFAVHSAKDLPAMLPHGLVVAAISKRNDPRDVLVNRWNETLDRLPAGARLGTSSPRRAAQIKSARGDIQVLPIRGNVGTRLTKGQSDEYDGVVLAAAGLNRLNLSADIAEYLSPDIFTPSVGQGALAVEARASDDKVIDLLKAIDHGPTNQAVTAERTFLATLGGGCKVPVSAFALVEGDSLHISTVAGTPDGSQIYRTQLTANADDPISAGRRAAEQLMETGAKDIIEESPSR